MSRSWLLYLDDLIASAEKIGRLTAGRNIEQFVGDEAAYDAVLFNLQVVGEAVKKLPESARAAGRGNGPAAALRGRSAPCDRLKPQPPAVQRTARWSDQSSTWSAGTRSSSRR